MEYIISMIDINELMSIRRYDLVMVFLLALLIFNNHKTPSYSNIYFGIVMAIIFGLTSGTLLAWLADLLDGKLFVDGVDWIDSMQLIKAAFYGLFTSIIAYAIQSRSIPSSYDELLRRQIYGVWLNENRGY